MLSGLEVLFSTSVTYLCVVSVLLLAGSVGLRSLFSILRFLPVVVLSERALRARYRAMYRGAIRGGGWR